MIEVQLNGEMRQLSDSVNVEKMLEQFKLPRQRVAVEINKVVVRKQDWSKTTIGPNDIIEVIHFVGGG